MLVREGLDQARVLEIFDQPRRYESRCSEALLRDADQCFLGQVELQMRDKSQQGIEGADVDQSRLLKELSKLNGS